MRLPIVAPDKVFDVTAMSVGIVNPASVDFCHFTTLPVLPLRVRSAGEVPEQIVWLEDTVPPTEVGSTVMVTVLDVAGLPVAQVAFEVMCTVIVAPLVNVVEV